MTADRPSPALQQLLVVCTREHAFEQRPPGVDGLLRTVDQSQLVALAELHRVSPAVSVSLSGSPALAPETAVALDERRRSSTLTQLMVEAELATAARCLGDLPWLVVKGPVLARHYYRRPELRSYVDLDLLVPPAALGAALESLESGGYRLLDRNWTMLSQQLSGELHLLSPRGVMIDLHWDLFNDRATRDSYAMVTSSFFERSREVNLGSLRARTLDPFDTLIHTAVHAARSGGDRLVWMKDLEQILLAEHVDWSGLAARCAEHRARLPVAVMLRRSRATLGVPGLPDAALDEVGGVGVWRWLGRGVDRLSPVAASGPEGSLSRMYARATRADGRGTATELSRRLVARARRQAWHLEETPTWDPDHPESVLHDSGGPQARRAFLDAVRTLAR